VFEINFIKKLIFKLILYICQIFERKIIFRQKQITTEKLEIDDQHWKI
jgi:hypothetical protein